MDFNHNMTHDLRPPLATVKLAVEALQDPELSSHAKFKKAYLGIIRMKINGLVAQVRKRSQAACVG